MDSKNCVEDYTSCICGDCSSLALEIDYGECRADLGLARFEQFVVWITNLPFARNSNRHQGHQGHQGHRRHHCHHSISQKQQWTPRTPGALQALLLLRSPMHNTCRQMDIWKMCWSSIFRDSYIKYQPLLVWQHQKLIHCKSTLAADITCPRLTRRDLTQFGQNIPNIPFSYGLINEVLRDW